jgi:glycosyltransferase involved in cell wall biosynthesis
MNDARKPVVLFMGAFSRPAGGVMGGQYQACRQLLDSRVSQFVRWRLVDGSMKSLPPPGLVVRSWFALVRLVKVVGWLLFSRVDTLLVFAPFGHVGVLDKGLMCFFGRLLRKRVVVTFRSEIRPSRRWQWLTAAFVRLMLRSVHVVIAQSPMAAEKLVALFGCDPNRITIIPNWMDPSPYAPLAAARESRPPEKTPVVLYVGWLEPFKGIFTLAEAAARLKQQGRKFRLVYCGSGGAHEELARRCQEIGITDIAELRGWVVGEQKIAAYREADLLVLVSQREGMPNVVMEAMAAGLPVVATPVGGIPSLVESGHNGLLVPPDRPDELAAAIAQLLDVSARAVEMGRAGHQRIMANHNVENLWPRLAEVVIGKPPALAECHPCVS